MFEIAATLPADCNNRPCYLLVEWPDNLYIWLALDHVEKVHQLRQELKSMFRLEIERPTRRTNLQVPEQIPSNYRWYLKVRKPGQLLVTAISRALQEQFCPVPDPPPPVLPSQQEDDSGQSSEELEEIQQLYEKDVGKLARDIAELRQENGRLKEALSARAAENRQLTESARTTPSSEQQVVKLLQTLLPRLSFLRDSISTLFSELDNPDGALKFLRTLHDDPGSVRAERVESADGWLEKHLGPDGRVYFRGPAGSRYEVLISTKKAQKKRDFPFLKKQARR